MNEVSLVFPFLIDFFVLGGKKFLSSLSLQIQKRSLRAALLLCFLKESV